MSEVVEVRVKIRDTSLHVVQDEFVQSKCKRIVIRAGRRGGKTVGAAKKAILSFLDGMRVLYAAPTGEQTDRAWFEAKRALDEPVKAGVYRLNENERYIEKVGTLNRIKFKTAWNANTLRGDFADLLILDEYQLMAEDTWEDVGQPMLADNNGNAVFIYTPPSLLATGVSKARDPRHASKLFRKAMTDSTGLWKTYHFSSWDNPYISHEALDILSKEMSLDSYRREILAEDDEVEKNWMVYSVFNAERQRVDPFPIPDNWLNYVGHDFGQANPAALFVAQDPGTGLFYVWGEYLPGAGKSVAQHVEAFKKITDGKNVLFRVGGNQNTEEEIRQAYTAHGWAIQAPKIKQPKAQLDRVLGMMNLNKIYVFKGVVNYLNELASCMWELDNDNKATDKIKNESKWHLSASARYLFSEFTPETILKPVYRPIHSLHWGSPLPKVVPFGVN